MKLSKIKIHSTKSGSQFVKPGDVFRSAEFKRDAGLIRRFVVVQVREVAGK
jgi:hypothetical protein